MVPHERKLSGTQQRTATEVQGLLASGSGNKLVLLEGLSGAGKSAVIDHLKSNLDPNRVTVQESLHLGWGIPADYVKAYFAKERVLSTATPREIDQVKESASQYFPDFEIVTPVLKGMTLPESIDFVKALKGNNPHKLDDEALAKFSLGLPLLAQELVIDPMLEEELAAHIAGRHLVQQIDLEADWSHLKPKLDRYLQFHPSYEVFEAARRNSLFGRKYIYDPVGPVLGRMAHLRSQGVQEESPFFVAEESVDIYNKMLSAGSRSSARIDIFVPELGKDDFQRAAQALGFAEYIGPDWSDVGDLPNIPIGMVQNEATRFNKMFGWLYRKTAIWYRNLEGNFGFSETESDSTKGHAEKAEEDFLAGKLPLKPTLGEGVGRLFFHKHAHPEQSYDPAHGGWIVESMLQQRGVPYLVNNHVIESTYVYKPSTKTVEHTDFNITKGRWD